MAVNTNNSQIMTTFNNNVQKFNPPRRDICDDFDSKIILKANSNSHQNPKFCGKFEFKTMNVPIKVLPPRRRRWLQMQK